MNLTNKAGSPAAEQGEPRAGTKGNADQHSTCRAQDRESVSQVLDRIRQAARHRTKEKFTALFHHINPEALRTAFYALKREVREHIAELVADAANKVGGSLGVSHDGLAAVLCTSIDGMILQKLIDPAFDLEGGFDALEKLLLALLRVASSP